MKRWQPWLIILCAALVLAAAPAAWAQDTGLKIVLDQQPAGSKTLSGRVSNVGSNVTAVALTLKVTSKNEQVQVTDASQDWKFSFSDVASWVSLAAAPVTPPGRDRQMGARAYPSGTPGSYAYTGMGPDYCGTGYAYSSSQPGYYGYGSGQTYITGYYLAP